MSNIIIVGAGGFGLEVAAYIEDMRRAGKIDHTIRGFIDDTKPAGTHHAGHSVLGPIDGTIVPDCLYVIAVGMPEPRKKLAEKLTAQGARFFNILHPMAYIAPGAKIGTGTIVAPFAFVGPEVTLGNHCLLNIYASAGHECHISDYCTLSPYAAVHGAAVLEQGIFMGSHSCITPKVCVGAHARIAAGSVVYNEIPGNAHVFGNPAKHQER